MVGKKIKLYNLTPVDGEALLSYKGRLNAEDLYMQLYDIDENKGELVNVVEGKPKDGLVFDGDCLSVCAYLKEHNIQVDLVYIDPPFASSANYSKKLHLRNKKAKDEMKATCDSSIGEEIMYSDIWKKEDYLNWLYTRLIAIKEIMSDDASIYVHLDWHIGHYVKVLLDEIFGEENFKNEIIWHYQTYQGQVDSYFPRKHDTIFLYSKSNNPFFVLQKDDNPEGTIDFTRWNSYLNENNEITGANYPKTDSRFDGYIKRFIKENHRNPGPKDVILRIEGNTIDDVWDIKAVDPKNKSEKEDYITQKPEELLKRIIKASSTKDMVVADFFGGSGVTAKVSYDLGRKFITGDVGTNAIQTIRDRLKKAGASFEIIDIKDGLDLFRNPAQTIKQLFKLCSGEKRNSDSEYSSLWDGLVPYNKRMLYTKIIDNRKIIDENYLDYLITEISQDYINDMQDEYLILYVFKDENLSQKVVDKKIKEKGLDFKVYFNSIESILKEKQQQINIPDSVNVSITKKNNKYEVNILNYFSPYLKKKIDDENQKRINKSKNNIIKISESGYEFIEYVSFDTTLKNKWISTLEEKAEIGEQISGKYLLDTDKFKLKIRNIAGDELIISSEDLKNE